VQLLDARNRVLAIVAQRGYGANFLQAFRCVSADDGSASGRALRTRQPVLIEDVTSDAEFAPYRGLAAGAGFRAVQSTPLIASTDECIGVILYRGDFDPFRAAIFPVRDQHDVDAFYAQHAAEIIARLSPGHQ
jgi:GAF domain-containing protein